MAVDDVAQALIDLHDESTRKRVAAGDFSGLKGTRLTEEERTLVQQMAQGSGDVEPFGAIPAGLYPGMTYVAKNRALLTSDTRLRVNRFFQHRYGGAWTIALMG